MPIIGAVAVCLSALLTAFLLLAHGPLRRANRLLAGFMLLTAIDLIGWMVPLLPDRAGEFIMLREPLGALQMPLLYAYMRTLCFPDTRPRWNGVAGALALAISTVSLIPRALWLVGWRAAPPIGGADLIFNVVALHIQYYVYAALMAALLWRYFQARQTSSDGSSSLVGPWLGSMLGISFAAHSLVLAKSWAGLRGDIGLFGQLEIIVGLVALVISAALALAAMLFQPLFVGMTSPRRRRSATRDQGGSTMLDALDRYMTEHQPFLDPALTVRGLARRFGIGQRELSELLNGVRGMHFFDYVNRYRIDRAAALLADPAQRTTTVLEIAHLAGFNTKSSFNAAFARHRGETPTQYRARVATDFA